MLPRFSWIMCISWLSSLISLSLSFSVSSFHSWCPHPALLQEFSFTQVWYSNQQPVHCAFSLQRHSASTTQLSCKISVRQVKGHEQLLQVYTSVGEVRFTLMSPLCLQGMSLFSQPRVYFFLKKKKRRRRVSSKQWQLIVTGCQDSKRCMMNRLKLFPDFSPSLQLSH